MNSRRRLYLSEPREVEAFRYYPWRTGLVGDLALFIAGLDLDGRVTLGDRFKAIGDHTQPAGRWDPPAEATLLIRGAQEWIPVPLGHWVVRPAGDRTYHWAEDPDDFVSRYRPRPRRPNNNDDKE